MPFVDPIEQQIRKNQLDAMEEARSPLGKFLGGLEKGFDTGMEYGMKRGQATDEIRLKSELENQRQDSGLQRFLMGLGAKKDLLGQQQDFQADQKELDRQAALERQHVAVSGQNYRAGLPKGKSPVTPSELTDEQRLAKQGPDAKNKIGGIASAVSALNDMESSLNSGVGPRYLDANTPLVGKAISDTPYSKGERVLSEVIGRLQSGGAINKDEEKRFLAMGPRPGDSPEIQRQKLQDQHVFLNNKLAAYGFKADQLPNIGFTINQVGGGTSGIGSGAAVSTQSQPGGLDPKMQRLMELRAKKAQSQGAMK